MKIKSAPKAVVTNALLPVFTSVLPVADVLAPRTVPRPPVPLSPVTTQ